jgi:outer membrane protein OmpA-like peptidoglycan-associated protein
LPDRFYSEISKFLEGAVDGGCVAVISSDGVPRVLYENCFSAEKNRIEREKKNESRKKRIEKFLMDENEIRAVVPENDLLKAIQHGARQLNAFESQSKRKLREKRIVIMNNGIVTTGEFDFTASAYMINKYDFKTKKNEVEAFAAGIAEKLSMNGELPNLGDVNITFMGLGDVAPPQEELSMKVREGLIILWRTIFEKCNVPTAQIDIKDWPPNTGNPNVGLPQVTPIFFFNGIMEIPDSLVTFSFGQSVYKDPSSAEKVLRNFSNEIIEYIAKNKNAKIYVVGSESKHRGVPPPFTTALSESRAKTVMETLVRFGVPRNQMEAFGLAVDFPRREDEWKSGAFDPIIGAKNQKVVLIPDNIEDVKFLEEVRSARAILYGKR